MQDAASGCRMQDLDAGCRMQDAECRTWMQDDGCWMQDTGSGCRMQDAGYRMQDAGCWMLDVGCWMRDGFLLGGGSSSAAVSHTCTQCWLCATGLGSSKETPQSRGQCLQDLNRYSSNLPAIITELRAASPQPLRAPAGYYSILQPCRN